MNNKTSIEEDIIVCKHIIKNFEDMRKNSLPPHKFIINSRDCDAIENILADRERLEKENKKNKDALEILNKMKKKYKIALFMIIRNSIVLPKGIELQKSSKEISKMSYETMCEVLTMIDFKTAEKMYEEGKSGEHI